jgi:hypothetical protein
MKDILKKVKPANIILISIVILILSNLGNSIQPRGYVNRGLEFDIGSFLGFFLFALLIAFLIELVLASRRKE